MFIRIQLNFYNSFPTFPAGKGNSFGAAQAGQSGEVLGAAVGAEKDFAHNSLLVIGYWLLIIRYLLLVKDCIY
jgi:hypothetical protein